MANNKLVQLTPLTNAAADDLLYIVDVSDSTDDPTGTGKKITRKNFENSILTNYLSAPVTDDDTITIVHNLGRKPNTVFFERSDGEVFAVLVAHASVNQMRVDWSPAMSGNVKYV